MKYNVLFGSHIPILLKVMSLTNKPVLELGVGLSSTHLLHWLCFENKRLIHSYENDPIWYHDFRYCRCAYHRVRYVKDWDKISIEDINWGVVLVDHAPKERRNIEAIRVANNADFVILHDTELSHERYYKYRDPNIGAFARYKYRYEYKLIKPETTILSNTIDVSKLI